ncbi:MAG: formyltransferase [Desulfobulbaceae bacterium]|nr:formyltransferase [Desulfobulbaceae bacterium]
MSDANPRAVVFAYHNIGVRGLAVLLANGVEVCLVVTHTDNPTENIWFGSVAELAALNGIPVITPADPNLPEVIEQIKACAPEWFFSFYYRNMLKAELLAIPTKGAYNLHGSLLPKYRGRVPINWAVLHGEAESGASLHGMYVKADAGPLVDQEAVPILPNDTAHEVFQKVACAGERVLLRAVPALLNGTAKHTPLDLSAGNYYGGRRPEDGRIDWQQGAWPIHNLIRAVAPPYPGAFFAAQGKTVQVLGSYFREEAACGKGVRLYWEDGRCRVDCCDGKRLCLTRVAVDGKDLDEVDFQRVFGTSELHLA